MKKMIRQTVQFTAVAGLSVMLLSGCNEEEPEVVEEEVAVEDLLTEVQAGKATVVDELSTEFLQGNAQFSLDLFKELAAEENAVYSPVPVYTSLALIANGVETDAQAEIFKALDLESLDVSTMNASYQKLMQELTSTTSTNELILSNSIWYDLGFSPNAQFLETNKTYYEADSYRLDFSDPTAKLAMNDWVDEATKGKIEQMIDEIDPSAVMYLFSTIYFNADWKTPFEASASYEGEFSATDQTVKVDKMSGVFDLETLETADVEGVVLPYAGENYSFVALMPKEETLDEYLSGVGKEEIINLLGDLQQEEVELHLPKFEVQFENVLNDSLKALGIQTIFNPNTEQLNPMGTADGNLFVNRMFQKTYLAVDEEGTEAASAVGTEISETSILIPEVRIIDFDRPFFYGIVENETGLPLFIGRMDRPE